jgi:hypothetical protein
MKRKVEETDFFFYIVSTSGKRMVVSSTAQGLWMGSADGSIPHQQVMNIVNITQIGILQDNHVLLILAGN